MLTFVSHSALKRTFLLLDAKLGPQKSDEEMMDFLQGAASPFQVRTAHPHSYATHLRDTAYLRVYTHASCNL